MDGRNEETMDMIVDTLKTAAYGLPVTFRVTPFDTPLVNVYIVMDGDEEGIGTLMWTTSDIDRDPETNEWWCLSLIAQVVSAHGRRGLRAALARCLNHYVDKRVGLI